MEMMAAMTIGLVIIAGIVSLFVSISRVQTSDARRSELLADLQLASQIIRAELHFAQDICTASNGTVIIYQPLDSYSTLPTNCDSVADNNGEFKLKSVANCGNGSTACICWDRPNANDGCQELIRNIKPDTGMSANIDSYGVVQVDIYGQYAGVDRSTKELTTRVTIWPRNK